MPGATGYLIRYGIGPDKLYRSREIRGQREITFHAGLPYRFTIDAFNAAGVTAGSTIAKI